MATYAIGDVQGCHRSLLRLLDTIAFDRSRDTLWLVGDLVNRGPASLDVLRFVRDLGERAVCVLGNHDLHLLAVAAGHGKLRDDDTIDDVLGAPDRDELLRWLRQRPLMHHSAGWVMVHAGLLPQWSIGQALALAAEVEQALRGDDFAKLFANMYGNEPNGWDDGLQGFARLRVIVNAMTRMRVCTAEGAMALKFSGEPKDAPAGTLPWFDVPGRQSRDTPVVFGHWSALGLLVRGDITALDSGCLWGRQLSAMRLEDRQVFQVSCAEEKAAGREQ